MDKKGEDLKFVIGDKKGPSGRIKGSHPVSKMRDRDGNDWPEDSPRRPARGHPELSVSAPDMAVQFSSCLENMGQGLESVVVQAVKDALGSSTDVRYVCLDNSGRIGIWNRPSTSASVDPARDRGLAAVSAIDPGEQFAVWINADSVRNQAQSAWSAAPKRFDHEGQPADDGPIHLTSLDVAFSAPDNVVTTVKGYDETTWPAVDFTLTATDRIVTSAFHIQVMSESQLETDATWFNALTGIFVALGFLLSPVFFLPALGFAIESAVVTNIHPDIHRSGVGALVARSLPQEIMIQGGRKLEPVYHRVDVNSGGLIAAGQVLVLNRTPSVSIESLPRISVPAGASTVTRTFKAIAQDLRGRLTVAWTGDGSASPADGKSTSVTFSTNGVTRNHPVNKHVTVHVTDRDGLTASASTSVQLFTTRDESGDPPVCRVRPWLEQCQ